MQQYTIGKYKFTDEDTYQAARRDVRKIGELERKGRSTAEIARNYKRQLKDKGIRFESVVGEEFVEGLDASLFLEPQEQRTARSQTDSRKMVRSRRANGSSAFKVGTIAALIVTLAAVVAAFGLQLYQDYLRNKSLENLALVKEEVSEIDTTQTVETEVVNVEPSDEGVPQTITRAVMPQYTELYNRNPDLCGWLRIPDTVIDYPVMWLEGDNDFYLKHNFNKEVDKQGLLVLDKRCNSDASGTNLLIHGHHMKSGAMFGTLKYYEKLDYFLEHPYIYFDSLYEERMYGIIAVFISSVYNSNEGEFAYYDYIQIGNEEDFNTYVEQAKANSLYETGMTAAWGDELITLSTCEYSRANGRLVIVGRRLMQ